MSRTITAIDLFLHNCAVCGFSWASKTESPAVCRRCKRYDFRRSRQAYSRGHYAGHIADSAANYKTQPAEYRAWSCMLTRCRNPRRSDWPRYGGRGITVCERWNSFAAFFADMRSRPSPRHSLDSINANGNYERENCRWATPVQQARNVSRNRVIVFDGRSRSLAEWSELSGLKREVIQDRLNRGWTAGNTLATPIRRQAKPTRRVS